MKKIIFIAVLFFLITTPVHAAQVASVPVYSVAEIPFTGPNQTPSDTPARDIDFWAVIKSSNGTTQHKVYGYWDGNGNGGTSGSVFKIRFTPTLAGEWTIIDVHSNNALLNDQHEGDTIMATSSNHKGFWVVDTASAGGRWYKRSNGHHEYIYGNTHYNFLTETVSTIPSDVSGNAQYVKKLRFSVHGDKFVIAEKPFFTSNGTPTDDSNGNSIRPNPAWFQKRVDLAVKEGYSRDLIMDLILAGPYATNSRAALLTNPGPFLKYIAARYGAYPNVWLKLVNEWDIKSPTYSCSHIKSAGETMKSYLSYPVPLSVHGNTGNWSTCLNGAWLDHVILQKKLKVLYSSADMNRTNYTIGGSKPVVNDELAYEGSGDGWSELDTIESMTGAFIGGGYASTGYKPGAKIGQYFTGGFNATAHSALDNIKWLADIINNEISFWKMAPIETNTRFNGAPTTARAMEWTGTEIVLGTSSAASITATLPTGSWTVKQYNVVSKQQTTLSTNATGSYAFSTPSSRAVVTFFEKNGGVNPPTATVTPVTTGTPIPTATRVPTTTAVPTPTAIPTGMTGTPTIPRQCPKKNIGDADCMQTPAGRYTVSILDYAIWYSEFIAGCSLDNLAGCAANADGMGNAMDANFNFPGTNYIITDTKVDIFDYAVWIQGFLVENT